MYRFVKRLFNYPLIKGDIMPWLTILKDSKGYYFLDENDEDMGDRYDTEALALESCKSYGAACENSFNTAED
jgi:hypothetical protein